MIGTVTPSHLDEAISGARAAVSELLDAMSVGVVADGDGAVSPDAAASRWADTLADVESIARLTDAARLRAIDPIVDDWAGAETTQRLGFRSTVDAIAIRAGVSEREARTRLRLTGATRREVSLTGASLAPRYPAVATAVHNGELGAEAAELIVRELTAVEPRADAADLRAAERNLVQIACGTASEDEAAAEAMPDDTAPECAASASTHGSRVSVDALKGAAKLWSSFIDPDGVAPKEHRAMRRRSLRFSATPAPVRDGRTPDQQRHDALAGVISAAARTVDAPELSGTGPAVLVTVRGDALSDPDGCASDPIGIIDGADTPASRALVERLVEINGRQHVTLDSAGAIIGIGSVQRTFTGRARRAIMARDGGCVIPGCTIPAGWTEIHVIPDRHDSPTHSSNGVCLCWWHHSTIDSGPWRLSMIAGVPHIRGPGTPDWVRARHVSAPLGESFRTGG